MRIGTLSSNGIFSAPFLLRLWQRVSYTMFQAGVMNHTELKMCHSNPPKRQFLLHFDHGKHPSNVLVACPDRKVGSFLVRAQEHNSHYNFQALYVRYGHCLLLFFQRSRAVAYRAATSVFLLLEEYTPILLSQSSLFRAYCSLLLGNANNGSLILLHSFLLSGGEAVSVSPLWSRCWFGGSNERNVRY